MLSWNIIILYKIKLNHALSILIFNYSQINELKHKFPWKLSLNNRLNALSLADFCSQIGSHLLSWIANIINLAGAESRSGGVDFTELFSLQLKKVMLVHGIRNVIYFWRCRNSGTHSTTKDKENVNIFFTLTQISSYNPK